MELKTVSFSSYTVENNSERDFLNTFSMGKLNHCTRNGKIMKQAFRH